MLLLRRRTPYTLTGWSGLHDNTETTTDSKHICGVKSITFHFNQPPLISLEKATRLPASVYKKKAKKPLEERREKVVLRNRNYFSGKTRATSVVSITYRDRHLAVEKETKRQIDNRGLLLTLRNTRVIATNTCWCWEIFLGQVELLWCVSFLCVVSPQTCWWTIRSWRHLTRSFLLQWLSFHFHPTTSQRNKQHEESHCQDYSDRYTVPVVWLWQALKTWQHDQCCVRFTCVAVIWLLWIRNWPQKFSLHMIFFGSSSRYAHFRLKRKSNSKMSKLMLILPLNSTLLPQNSILKTIYCGSNTLSPGFFQHFSGKDKQVLDRKFELDKF